MRLPWENYVAKVHEIEFIKEYGRDEILSKPNDLALEAILHVVTRFGWDRPPVDVIKQDQENLVTRRF